jgi:hypothetical protein
MQPFAPPSIGTSGPQIDFDARRVDYLERVVVRSLLKSAPLDAWNARERAAHPVAKPGTDPPEMVSRYDAGYATLCDAVADVGLRVLDPGLDDVREALRSLPPDAQTDQLRAWLTSENRPSALARAMLARADPSRVDELFGWTRTGINLPTYWAPTLGSVHMEYLLDTADFGANELLRVLYLLAAVPDHLRDAAQRWRDPDALDRDANFPAGAAEQLRSMFTTFKYWFDDPFRCSEFTGRAKEIREQATPEAKVINHEEKMDPGADMTYWSENHRLLFATAEYLAGQWWPDDLFVSARNHRKEGPGGPPRQGDIDGSAHRDRGRARALRWLNERLRLGFSEWNAPGYYVEDLLPLLNLIDFAADEQVSTRAAMVADMLVLDLAVNHQGGAFAGSAGRAYFEHKNCVWEQSVRDTAELLFAARGHYVGMDNAAIFLATSPVYRPPDAVLAIAARPPARATSRSRVSITFGEAPEHGVGFASPDDMEFWWSRGAYAAKQTILGSHKVAADYGLLKTPPFKDIIPMIEAAAKAIDAAEDVGAGILGGLAGAAAGFAIAGPLGAVGGAVAGAIEGSEQPHFSEADAADLASVITEGSVLSRSNLYAHKAGGALLASAQNFRPGQLNFQSLPCVAALENGAMVWTTYPSAGSHLGITFGTSTWMLLGAIVGGPIGLVVGAFLPEAKIVDEDLFKADTHDGPNWWTGNAVQPRVVQQRGAAIVAYQAQEIQKLLFGQRTHAWFPKRQFDDVCGPQPGRANIDSGRWFFGRAGDSYVGLFSALETDWTSGGPWQDVELRAEGPTNVFVTQIGSAAEFGSFERFVAEVADARINVSGLHLGELECSYDVPRGRRLELHYDSDSRYGGETIAEDEFPRLLNPYTRIAWQQDRYVVQYGDRSVVHDVVAGKRTIGGRLDQLEHDTPLTFYAQNMALLPWPLYKGVDRDRALDHLIEALRTRAPDLVGLSEVWTDADRGAVRDGLADIYPYTIDGPHDPLLDTPFRDVEMMGGGLLLMSRHRIVASSSSVYRQCAGDDCHANKGVLHARVCPRGHPCTVDVFLTHSQAADPAVAGTTAAAREAVEAQIRHLAAFIRGSRDAVCPAVLFGDFNIDAFAHPDLYMELVSTLGAPTDPLPAVNLEGRSRPTGTSESDDGHVSSFARDHLSRPAEDPTRFGDTTERLDYVFLLPGLLYGQHTATADVVVEQWEPGRDMSDHYGVETFVDTTVQSLPEDRPIESAMITLSGFRCLQSTSGPGADEVVFTLTARPDLGGAVSVEAPETDGVEAGSAVSFDPTPIALGDPGEELELVVDGREIDALSIDDSLGSSSRTLRRDELLAAAAAGSLTIGMPVSRGDGAEYVVDLELIVQAPGTETKPPTAPAASTGR